jgi:putative phosphoesterase
VLLAIIGDTHLPRGSRALPEECVRRLSAADLILHTGDHSAQSAYEELCALGPRVRAVHGNVDEPALRELLPEELVVEAGEARIGLIHDPGPRADREERLRARFRGCAAVGYGHTHVPQVELRAGVWILNPGSPTERRRSPVWTMLELRVEDGRLTPELIALS